MPGPGSQACPKSRPSLLTKRDKAKAAQAEERKVRTAVRKRDNGFCRVHLAERSFVRTGTEMHHIVPRSLGGKDSTSNCIWVCSDCHRERHAGVIRITGSGDGAIQVERNWT